MTTYLYQDGALRAQTAAAVAEFPLKLMINGRELATLVASPHDLRPLAVGFLRMQGFIDSLDDIQMLSVCNDFGVAQIRIRGELPERLRPVLTSGCGTGVTYSLATPADAPTAGRPGRVAPQAIFRLLDELARRAEQYREHGGLHSAAIGDLEGNLLLRAEDIGRHNTLDRIAGAALLQGIDLAGRILVTSGRVSAELAAKAARLGLLLVASRTAVTDMARTICEEAGIALVGYVRGQRMTVHCHAERLVAGEERLAGITGVILAGGKSVRMGSDKSLLPLHGGRFIDHVWKVMSSLFDEVIIVTNSPELYSHLPCRTAPDIYPVRGSLTGIHAGLCHSRSEKIFVVACDMPFLDPAMIRTVCTAGGEHQVAIPRSEHGLEPLHALYHRDCIPAIEAVLDQGRKRIVAFFPQVRVCEVACDCDSQTFANINTPQEYFALRGDGESEAGRTQGTGS